MTDVFRKEYKPLTEDQKTKMEVIKRIAGQLWDVIDLASTNDQTDKRCLSIAKTELESCVMWATKGITQ
jgi:hypothetical protein